MDITLTQAQSREPVTVLHLKGDFDANGAAAFNARVQELIAVGVANILVDLAAVRFMSSAGLLAIHKLFYQLHPKDTQEFKLAARKGAQLGAYKASHLKLLNPNARLLEVLEMTGIDRYISILTGDEQQAVLSF